MEMENCTIVKKISLNHLAETIKEKIKCKTDFFKTTNIIFPNEKVSQWFKAYWLKTETDVLMNVKFFTLENGLLSLIKTDKPYKLVNRNELRTYIIKHLSLLDKDIFDKNVSSYIYSNGQLDSIRLFDLANLLSKLFIQYERENIEIVGWQKTLYDNVLEELDSKNKATFAYINKHKSGFINNDEVIFFGFNIFDNIYQNVINELSDYTNVIIYQIDNELNSSINPKLCSAPSKMREIEQLHSEICKLVQKEDVKYSDILVMCTNLGQYELEISKVFNQDNVNFPNIPYSLSNTIHHQSDLSSGLEKLFEIASKGFYTRMDFTEIISNKVIEESRGITPDDVSNWKQSIIEMNVYRNGKAIDDWDYAKKRVVLSKVSSINDIGENIVELIDGKYMPFSNISFSDDSIVRFASLIDDLNKWIKDFNSNCVLSKEKIETLSKELSKWFSIISFDGFELNKIFRKIQNELELWLEFELDKVNIPLNTLFYTLFELSEENKFNTSRLFTEGVSFVNYEENIILSSKYLFFLGLGSSEFPKRESVSEISLLGKVKDDGISSFICQANNSENLYLSYVNHNLKTDEEYYPSTYILKLFEMLGKKVTYDYQIGIDETRVWSELFTKKEYKEKDYYYGLFNNDDVSDDDLITPNVDVVKKVTVSQMKRFLTEPLKYKAEYLFGHDDETMDMLSDEYEPFKLDYLNKFILVKAVVSYLLKNPDCVLVDEEKNVNFPLAKTIFERFIIEHKIPNINEEILISSIEIVVLEGNEVAKNIREVVGSNFEIVKIKDVKFDFNDDEIVLMYNNELCLSVTDNNRKYIEIRGEGSGVYALFLNMYICALMDVSTLNDDEYKIEIYCGKSKKEFTITPFDAYSKLIEIYKEMSSYELNAYMPIDLIDKNTSYEKFLRDAMGDKGEWKFFKGKKIFDQYKDLGYTEYDYDLKSSQMKNMLRRLVVFTKREEE